MKNSFLKSAVLENRWRCGVLIFAVLCLIVSGFTPGSAQLKNRKRVTSLQLGDSAEGARVTVVSDSALSDYEAFRRGDRFYVKIPLADFATAIPGFRGDGFDDVQVQTVGDTVVISFKLQPGATARVDQRANRLDVVFSAPNRIARNNSGAVFNRVSSSATTGINRVNSSTTTKGSSGDSAGPIPPASSQAYRERLVTARPSDGPATPRTGGSSRKTESSAAIANSSTAKSASASSSPSATLPSSTPYSYQPSATPVAPVSSQTSVSSPSMTNSQSSRGKVVREWISAHRALFGSVLALAALFLLAALLYRRRKSVVKTKAGKEPRVQPRYSPDIALNDSLAADAKVSAASRPGSKHTTASESTATPSQVSDEYKIRPVPVEAAAPTISVLSPSVSRTSAPEKVESIAVPEAAMAGSFGVEPSNYARVLSSPSISSPASGDDPFISEDQDREVFEL